MDAISVDHDIQQALAVGDLRRAGRALVVHHADAVHAMCRALVRDRTLAEDLCQDAFVRAIAALPSFRGEAQSRTWLLSIARNLCIDHLRRTKGPIDERVELDTEVYSSDAPLIFDVLVRRGDVERALVDLTETERAIVVLHHAHGVGYPELAGSLGIAEGALRMRMSRALQKMRAAIDEADRASLGAPLPARAAIAGAPSKSRAEPGEGDELDLDESTVPEIPRGLPTTPVPSAPPSTPRKSGGLFERARQVFGGKPAAPPTVRAPRAVSASPAAAQTTRSPVWAIPGALRDRLLSLAG